ncbi:hypothetical protein FBULB1_11123 [Fusarium bulbicola]|nr:hypothetical protein FBULB1_11123 [Fusarium bulbicola]
MSRHQASWPSWSFKRRSLWEENVQSGLYAIPGSQKEAKGSPIRNGDTNPKVCPQNDYSPYRNISDSHGTPGLRWQKYDPISHLLREEDLKVVDFKETEDKLHVNWSDGHESQHPLSYLHCWFKGAYAEEFGKDHMIRLWDSSIETQPPSVPYNQFFVDHGWEAIDAPVYPESTEDLLKRLGPIRNTHYGGFYDFTPDLSMADTAYTNLALPAHTDTTYFTEPAGLQAFHCLSHEPAPGEALEEGESLGGESLLVDGFKVAITLRKENPWAFKTLAQVELPWHASGNVGISISPDKVYPVIEQEAGGHLKRIRWNNDDRGAVNPYEAKDWYAAARVWNEILRRKENEYWFKLEPGKIVIFNNWRILHGRSAFKGIRRICGAYSRSSINALNFAYWLTLHSTVPYDDFVSCYRVTNTPGGRVAGRSYNNRARMGYNGGKGIKDVTGAPQQEAPVIQKVEEACKTHEPEL